MEKNATIIGAEVTRSLQADGFPPEPVAMRVVVQMDRGAVVTVEDTPYKKVRLGDRAAVLVLYEEG